MARVTVHRRKDGKAKGVRVRTSGKNCRVKFLGAKAARVKKSRGRPG